MAILLFSNQGVDLFFSDKPERNSILKCTYENNKKFGISNISSKHDSLSFSCGDELFDETIRKLSKQKEPGTACKVALENSAIIGYYVFLPDNISLEKLFQEKPGKSAPIKKESIFLKPVRCCLAVDKKYRDATENPREELLIDALHEFLKYYDESLSFILRTPKSDQIFLYENYGFNKFKNSEDNSEGFISCGELKRILIRNN